VLAQVQPGYLAPLLPTAAPETPESFDAVLADFDSKIMPGVTHWQSPNFYGFFPANSSYPAILGDMYSDMINCIGFNWMCSPAMTELETVVLDWMAKLCSLPECFTSKGHGGGSIQGTASEAIIVSMLGARGRVFAREKERDPNVDTKLLAAKLVAYGSEETHSCLKKACLILNVTFRALPSDKNYSMRGETVQKQYEVIFFFFWLFFCKVLSDPTLLCAALYRLLLRAHCQLFLDIFPNHPLSLILLFLPDIEFEKADVAAGLIPFYVCGTIGTTSCTAVDNLGEIGQVARKNNLWFHIDAAYAGSAMVCPEYQFHLDGIRDPKDLENGDSLADSFNFNMHKWLLVNFDCSLLYIKQRKELVDALSVTPAYLRNKESESGKFWL
jgi:tyrosine decarboxylase